MSRMGTTTMNSYDEWQWYGISFSSFSCILAGCWAGCSGSAERVGSLESGQASGLGNLGFPFVHVGSTTLRFNFKHMFYQFSSYLVSMFWREDKFFRERVWLTGRGRICASRAGAKATERGKLQRLGRMPGCDSTQICDSPVSSQLENFASTNAPHSCTLLSAVHRWKCRLRSWRLKSKPSERRRSEKWRETLRCLLTAWPEGRFEFVGSYKVLQILFQGMLLHCSIMRRFLFLKAMCWKAWQEKKVIRLKEAEEKLNEVQVWMATLLCEWSVGSRENWNNYGKPLRDAASSSFSFFWAAVLSAWFESFDCSLKAHPSYSLLSWRISDCSWTQWNFSQGFSFTPLVWEDQCSKCLLAEGGAAGHCEKPQGHWKQASIWGGASDRNWSKWVLKVKEDEGRHRFKDYKRSCFHLTRSPFTIGPGPASHWWGEDEGWGAKD